jgi:predicted NBD/HSP70 family sugar kinase
VGLGTPGPLELPAGILHELPNLPGWDGFELRAELNSALNIAGISCTATIESDANVAALAECKLGAGSTHGVDSLCMLTLGTGVGNAIILNGAIWSGAHGMAGEAGHNSVWPDGLACNCGNSGCLEVYASATAVRRMAEDAADSANPTDRLTRRRSFSSPARPTPTLCASSLRSALRSASRLRRWSIRSTCGFMFLAVAWQVRGSSSAPRCFASSTRAATSIAWPMNG